MTRRRTWTLAVIVPLLSLYGYRAVVGVPAGIALARGRLEVSRGSYRAAIPQLQEADVGFDRLDALWLRADSAIDIWENEARNGGPFGADATLLTDSAQGYLEAICVAPASRRSLAGLALVYHKLEWMGRSGRVATGYTTPADPWLAVGQPGRVAIGFGRRAVERAPNWYVTRDWLARAFWSYGLESEARLAVREAAKTLPLYQGHRYLQTEELERALLADFISASREHLGQIPLVDAGTQLTDLGKLELVRGNADAAIADFNAALERRLDPVRKAEAVFNLGLALASVGRVEEALAQLRIAGEHPVFHMPVLINMAYFAERSQDDEAALGHLRELRRVDQDNVDYCLRYAAAAQRLKRWEAALEALRWARLVAPKDLRPLVALVEVHWAREDSAAARVALRDLQAVDSEGLETARLSALLTSEP